MEFPQVGEHCSVPSCNTLDFLPFKCQYCALLLCKLHCHPADHDCQHLPAQQQGSDSSHFKFSCGVERCKGRELVEVQCPQCTGNYCLLHRHPPDHACASLLPQPPSKQQLALQKVEQIAAAMPSKPKKKAGHKDPKLAAKVQLMKLKMKAVPCSSNMTAEERVYFLVLLPLSHSSRSIAVCLPSSWSVGRALDAIADLAKVRNRNNVSSDILLQLYRHHKGTLLPAATQLATLQQAGTLCNGETIVMESTVKGCSLLDNLDQYTIPS